MNTDYTISGYQLSPVVISAAGPGEALAEYMNSDDYNEYAWELNVHQGDNDSRGFLVMEVQIFDAVAYELKDSPEGLVPGVAIARRGEGELGFEFKGVGD